MSKKPVKISNKKVKCVDRFASPEYGWWVGINFKGNKVCQLSSYEHGDELTAFIKGEHLVKLRDALTKVIEHE